MRLFLVLFVLTISFIEVCVLGGRIKIRLNMGWPFRRWWSASYPYNTCENVGFTMYHIPGISVTTVEAVDDNFGNCVTCQVWALKNCQGINRRIKCGEEIPVTFDPESFRCDYQEENRQNLTSLAIPHESEDLAIAAFDIGSGIIFWPTLFNIMFLIILKIYLKMTRGISKSQRRIDGKVVIVTGANTGLGFETAKELARRGGSVVMACRNLKKGQEALQKIKSECPMANITLMHLDISSLSSVREFVKSFENNFTRLDILINNAGVGCDTKIITDDKFEMDMATNYYGPFLLTNLLLDLMIRTGNARILMVSSHFHIFAKCLGLDNLNSEKSFDHFMCYVNSKLCGILFTRELERRLRGAGIKEVTVNALCSGPVSTEFGRHWIRICINDAGLVKIYSCVFRYIRQNPWEGAQTQIHLALADEVEGLSGMYWRNCQESLPSKLARDIQLGKTLWDKAVEDVGLEPGAGANFIHSL